MLDCIAYTTDHAPKDYAAYLGNCIDKGWASEGYHAEKAAEEARRKEQAEETRRKKQADQNPAERKRPTESTVNWMRCRQPADWMRSTNSFPASR